MYVKSVPAVPQAHEREAARTRETDGDMTAAAAAQEDGYYGRKLQLRQMRRSRRTAHKRAHTATEYRVTGWQLPCSLYGLFAYHR